MTLFQLSNISRQYTTIFHLFGILTTIFSFTYMVGCSQTADKSPPRQGYATVYDAFTHHDTNADGIIDIHEFYQMQQDPEIVRIRSQLPKVSGSIPLLFEEIDEDQDGKITLHEMTTTVEWLVPAR